MRGLVVLLLLVTPAWAGQPASAVNHHVGDAGFVAAFGRPPTPADPEALRMHVHLQYVRDWLATRPPTSPQLAARRGELLGYLDDYIARGVTPRNTYVARRRPVFIDAHGAICAVGYLIDRSGGRALAERIARDHRLDYLEDIAAAEPEVADWVARSGFSLEELASIQPGYHGPDVMHADGFTADMPDGAYEHTEGGETTRGRFAHHQMTGAWTRVDGEGHVLGRGTFRAGDGAWTSSSPSGARLATGRFAASRAEGEWRIFHPSGRLAARGPMHQGRRDGTWTPSVIIECYGVRICARKSSI